MYAIFDTSKGDEEGMKEKEQQKLLNENEKLKKEIPKTLAQSIVDIGGTAGKKIPVNKPRYYGGAVPVYIGG